MRKWRVFKISDPYYTGYQPWRVVDPYGSIRLAARSFEDVKDFCADYFGMLR